MKTLFIDCGRGLATDMLCGALLGLFDGKQSILCEMRDKLPQNIVLTCEYAKSYDRDGVLFKIKSTDFKECGKHGTSFEEIKDLVRSTSFSQSVKKLAMTAYDVIADAECRVHTATKESVHFHEVGQKRAVFGVLCACFLIYEVKRVFGVDKCIFTHVNTGFGKTVCAHGEVDVPAPATKIILDGAVPFYSDGIKGELCTPCGGALARVFADDFCPKDGIKDVCVIKRSVGIGTRDIGIANGVVACLCE